MPSALHDRGLWRVAYRQGHLSKLETFGGQILAVRALIAAGAEGVLVAWGTFEKLRAHFAERERAGVVINVNVCADAAGQRFTLRARIKPNPGPN